MANPRQLRNLISSLSSGAATAALALAIMLVAAVLATGSAQAQTYTESVLYSFQGGTDGAGPYAGLVLDAQGNVYGTTYYGGDLACSAYGCGTVFTVDTTGKETVLYSFTRVGGDGAGPYAGLVLDAQGNLYGTTYAGGNPACTLEGPGCGTVFKVDTTGKETVLHSFTGTGGDGANPYAGLVRDAQGNLYGTTYVGGAGYGTVFKLDTTGKETVLYSFTGYDGSGPEAGLVLDAQGNLYGTTKYGGNLACYAPYGCGTVFKLDTTGKETVLYSFTGTGTGDGEAPEAGLVLDTKGNLYGTTPYGGTNGGASNGGTVFKVDTTGKETVLYSFAGTGAGDGQNPEAGLVLDAQGNLYGTTYFGGANAGGTVFKVDTTGKETVLHSFTGTGGGRRTALGRFSAGRAGQPVWHDLPWRRFRQRNGVQAGACGSDQDYHYALVFTESVHLRAGSDLYRSGHFQVQAWCAA